MKMLKPVSNYRNLYNRRCCSQCEYFNPVHFEGTKEVSHWACDREGGPDGDWNSIEPEFHVCDGFKWEVLDE
jgi:hypothetical protein